MRRTKLRRKSKSPQRKLEDRLWELCKNLIREKYGNTCYTCGATGLVSSNWHTGHLYAKASLGAYLKYDLRVLRPQCYKCNIHYGGMGAVFYSRMLKEEGADYMTQIEKDKQVTVKSTDYYAQLVTKYEALSTV